MSRGAVQETVPLSWSRSDARRFLARYHLSPGSLDQIIARLGSIQYDPLRPVGRNPDLVLQSRVPGYRVDSWEAAAYGDRLMIDAWDKQACLVPPGDWRHRWVYHDHFRERWRERVLDPYADQVEATLAQLAERGPLTSLDFENQERVESWQGSWYGAKLVKVILRALWDSGEVITHHRVKGRHAYALPGQVIPDEVLRERSDEDEALQFLIRRRHQSMGLLRANAQKALWSIPASSARRKDLLAQLVATQELVPVDIEGELYHLRREELEVMDWPEPETRLRFIAPLDPLVWDRDAVARIFDFNYVWEVYKPAAQRQWGYYVLPVFYGDRFVARADLRNDGDVLRVLGWWWENGHPAAPPEELGLALARFRDYLGVSEMAVSEDLPQRTRQQLLDAARLG